MTKNYLKEIRRRLTKMSDILTEIRDGILIISISRPEKLNALNTNLIRDIDDQVDYGIANDDIKGIIITGVGEKAFAAGADIAEFVNHSKEEAMAMAAAGHATFRKIETATKPVVAAVNGFALGGGCELAMACHFRVASETAKFGQPEVNLGLVPGYGGSQRLTQLIGRSRALQHLVTGDMIDAETALKLGLVNKVCEDDVVSESIVFLNKITVKAPLAVAELIQLVDANFNPEKDGFKEEIEAFGRCFDTQDFREGTQAFMEKRKANFKGI